jgi:hypothetical protein
MGRNGRGRPGPTPQQVARALRLHEQGKILTEIGRDLGVSQETARTYVRLGRNARQWLPAIDRAEVAANVNGVLLELTAWGQERRADPDAKFEQVAPALVAVLRLIVEVHGLKPPTQIDVALAEAMPDREAILAIREAEIIEQQDRDEITGSGT